MSGFGSRLTAAVAGRGPLCPGIDPHPELLAAWGLTADADGLAAFCDVCVAAFAGFAIVKPQVAFFESVGVGIHDAQIVQVDQEVRFLEPIQDGDKLYYDVYGESVRQAHGTDIIVLKSVVSNEAGDIVQESYTTLAGRSEGNEESGFNDDSA